MIWRALSCAALACAACQPPAMTPTLEPEPVLPDAAAPVAPPPPPATAAPKPRPTVARDAAPPPLSSPNPIVDGGAAPEAAAPAPSGPPKTTEEALSQAGHAVLGCFGGDQEMVGGVLVRVTVDTSGKVTRVDIVKDKSSAALLGGGLEKCIRDVFQKQRFPPQSTETVVDVPLDFKAPKN